jgi:ABC-type transport system involved in multi-copper enzyme maturation permease subunit
MSKILSLNWKVVSLISNQTLRSLAFSPGAYAVLSLGLIITALMTRNTLGEINKGYLSVISEPFLSPVLVMCLLGGLFIGLVAGLSVAREWEMGTLETIFYGPVSHVDYLVGKFIAHLIGYTVLLVTFLIACVILGWSTNLIVSSYLISIAGLSITTAMGLVGLGLLLAAIMRTMRGTLLLFLGIILVIISLDVGQIILTSIVTSRNFVGLIILRDTVALINRVTTWFSPFSYLLKGSDAVLRQNNSEWLAYIGGGIVYSGITLSLSILLLRKRGVIR